MSKKNQVNHLLMQQINVLSRIDSGSDEFFKKPYLKSTLDKEIKNNKLKSLEMSKKMAYACYTVMRYLNNEATLDRTMEVLKDCLETKYGHTYSVSAKWNLRQIYYILSDEYVNPLSG